MPKWNLRDILGTCLGNSPSHAENAALILNPSTGHVSPQYNLAFDDDFTTVKRVRSGTVPQNWQDIFSKSSESSTSEDCNLSQKWFR